jgi:hypothetical protein
MDIPRNENVTTLKEYSEPLEFIRYNISQRTMDKLTL